ncbi:hypothetical protein JZ751_029066 [Albula glossodonta]|uniref:Uncharacterized protein n=1 Tax=Albula glossodonta TaxID=121402 RepID=A0A8T2P927_9TELE|nr:hypothetical protein JZ751_029066 [Albula glossodonta]
MGSATAESANAMPASSGTTATAPQRLHHVCRVTGRSAVGGASASAGGASALSPALSGTPVRSAPPALMLVAQRGSASNAGSLAPGDSLTTRLANACARMRLSLWKR